MTNAGGGAVARCCAKSRVAIVRLRTLRDWDRLLFSIAVRRRGATRLQPLRVGSANQKDHNVPKEELLQFEGLVLEILPDARYRVQLDNGHELVAYTAGRMKKNRIKTLAGDRVTVEVSPYDLEKGRLIFRHKDERGGSAPRPAQRPQFRRR
jgi:translation initiation factor IF-1